MSDAARGSPTVAPGSAAAVAPRALGPWIAAALAVLGALAALGLLPATVQAAALAPLLAGGAALGPLRRLAPRSLAPLERGLFAALLTLPLWATADGLLRATWLRGEERGSLALAAVCLLVAALQGLAPRARAPRPLLGRSAVLALGLCLAAAAWTAAVSLAGNGPRLSHHGLLHAGLSLATERSVPPLNPWLAEAPLGYYWAWHALVGLVLRALSVAPTVAAAWVNVWAAATATLALYLTATVFFPGALWRRAAAVGLAWLGLNALGGWHALLSAPSGAPAPETSAQLLEFLRQHLLPSSGGVSWADPRALFGPSKFGNASSHPAALALALGAGAAAVVALGHRSRAHLVLCGLAVGGSFALNPLLGAATAGVLALAGLLGAGDPRVRLELPLAVVVGCLPGALLLRGAAAGYGGQLVELEASLARCAAASGPLLLLAPLAALGALALRREAGAGARARLRWLLLGAVLSWAAACAVALPYGNEYKFVRLAAVPLALLAAAARGPLALACAVPLLVGAAANTWIGHRAYADFAAVELPVEESAGRLLPVAGAEPEAIDAREAYRYLSTDPRLRALAPVLVADLHTLPGPRYGAGVRDAGYPFTDELNLQGHEAPTFAGLDLFVDRPSQVLDGREPLAAQRAAASHDLFRGREPWNEATRRTLFDFPRPLLVWVGPRQRAAHRELESGLARAGFECLFRHGELGLWLAPGAGAERWEELGR
jgi:hypothetical protein